MSVELVQHPMHAVYLLLFLGRPLITLVEGSLSAIYQLLLPYTNPEKRASVSPTLHVAVWRLRQGADWGCSVRQWNQDADWSSDSWDSTKRPLSSPRSGSGLSARASPQKRLHENSLCGWGLCQYPFTRTGSPLLRGQRLALYVISGNHNKAIPGTIKSN